MLRRMPRFAALLLPLLLAGCNVSEHRHAFLLVAGRDQQLVHAWLRPADSGPGSLWLDTVLFPLDFVASTWTCLTAVGDEQVAITGGPLGWLLTALPCCSANWYGDAARSPLPIRPFAPEPQPLAVPATLLQAVRAADTAAARRQAFAAAVAAGLPPGRPGSRAPLLDREFWQQVVRSALLAVELAAPVPP